MYRRLLKQIDFISGAALSVIGLFMLVDAINFGRFINGSVGADFFPKIASSCLLATGIGLVITAWGAARRDEKAGKPVPKSKATKSDYLSFLVTAALLFLYVGLLQTLGFILTTVLYLFAQITAITPKEKRNYLLIAAISVGIAIFAYMVFVNVFYVMLPAGIFA